MLATAFWRRNVIAPSEDRLAAKLRKQAERRARIPLTSAVIIGLLVFCAVFADLIAPHSPVSGELAARLRPPAWLARGNLTYPLGTDALGRDLLSRTLYGGRWRFTRFCSRCSASTSVPVTIVSISSTRSAIWRIPGRVSDEPGWKYDRTRGRSDFALPT